MDTAGENPLRFVGLTLRRQPAAPSRGVRGSTPIMVGAGTP